MRFTKMQGVGNDFVVLDAAALPADSRLMRLAITLCDRHTGVGADGLLVVARDAPDAAFSMRMFNPDGTEDMCGNGLRCVGLWAYRAKWVNTDAPFCVMTKEGLRPMRLLSACSDGKSGQLTVDMGLPKFSPADVPFRANHLNRVLNHPLEVAEELFSITALNTGSTHTVIFTDTPVDELTFQRFSPMIELHPLFPERTSVLWATRSGPNDFMIRIWERGVGETWGCGTGACAVAIAAQMQSRSAADAPVKIISKGGVLGIVWPGEGQPVQMSGSATITFDGEFVGTV